MTNKYVDMLKLVCTLTNLANICPNKSTDTNIYPLTEIDKNLLEQIWKIVVACLFILFTCRTVVDGTFLRKSTNICKSYLGFDASQLFP